MLAISSCSSTGAGQQPPTTAASPPPTSVASTTTTTTTTTTAVAATTTATTGPTTTGPTTTDSRTTDSKETSSTAATSSPGDTADPPTTPTTIATPPTVPTLPAIAPVVASSSVPAPPPPSIDAPPAVASVALPQLDAAFTRLLQGNYAASMTMIRDGAIVYRRAGGRTNGGAQLTTATPMVLASVSKLITALSIARLVEGGVVTLDTPVPWTAMGVVTAPGWETVTVRELLTHTGGMPTARDSWFNLPGSCTIPLQAAMATPPRSTRGTWTYSNGDYCALGLFIQQLTGSRFDDAARALVFQPLQLSGEHLTTDPPLPTDGPYPRGLTQLDRLGGAGTWMASTDAIAEMVATLTPQDRNSLTYPGVFVDQYGWGHTGTVDGAKACAWRIEGDRTTIVAVVGGNRPASGGDLCDRVLPALADDLGLGDLGKPERYPRKD